MAHPFERLKAHAGTLVSFHLADAFAEDPERFRRFSVRDDDLLLDYSKALVTPDTMELLLGWAETADVPGWRARMFSGEPINGTEGRAVLHVALRNVGGPPIRVAGEDVMPEVEATLERFLAFAEGVRDGSIAGAGGRFTDVVNIGIGGSDLGPRMVARALTPYRGEGPNVHFVANVDGADLADTLRPLDPARTLFLVASKTFTTLETMTNAASAREWLALGVGEDAVPRHFAALSSAVGKAADFGIPEERVFGFRDWVGGRYSVWSAIGLSVAIAIGADNFRAFLAGARAMDEHFRERPLGQNMPVLMALVGAWHRDVMGFPAHAVLPYDERLSRFAAHLQQLDMESNGKRVTRDGDRVAMPTGPVIFGEPGTNGQHAFFQLLHQGTEVVPCDFLVAANPHEAMGDHHDKLIANCLAQSEALMRGRSAAGAKRIMLDRGTDEATAERLAPHKAFPGNRPSNTLVYRVLDPFTLGRLIALYEHKVFVQGILWNVNSFDQWGVELGKELATRLLPRVKGEDATPPEDASTAGLLAALTAMRAR